ncbi:MAG: serine hydrolase [Planctomycetota bacterium]
MSHGRYPRRFVLTTLLMLVVGIAPAGADDVPDVIQRARQAVDRGRYAEAEVMLRAHVSDPDGPVVDQYAVELEIIRRIRLDFALTPERLLAQLRESIPDVTAEEVEQWRAAGMLQHREIDGEVRYFKRAAGNLFRKYPEVARRRESGAAPAAGGFDLPKHVALLLKEADAVDGPLVHPVKHHVCYALTVNKDHPRLKKGAKVRCWLPFPQQYRQQGGVRLISTEPAGGLVAPEGTPQRTVYFEQVIEDVAKPPTFVAEFEFVTSAYVPKLDPEMVRPYDTGSELYRSYAAERPPHILFFPELAKLAAEIVGDERNPLLKARRIFRWVDGNIPWCSEREYSTMRCIPAKALAARGGDCGVQGLTFITLCRAAGIPARWQSGWETLPGRRNMHDWSEFYVEPWGWLPADASYGLQRHDDPRVREFFCGHMDPYRLIVNLDYARELHPPKTSFRSEPNDFQRGEIEIDGYNLYFDEWDWDIEVRTTPLDGGVADLEEAFDAVVPKLLAEGDISGAVIAVGRSNRGTAATEGGRYGTWRKAYGFVRTRPERETMGVDAVFDMASMTKPIATGTSLLILVEQGRVGLDDPVGKYLPEFNTEAKKGVTVRHLMTHMSGMPPYVGAKGQKAIKDRAGFPCPVETRAFIRELELARPPGEAVVYSCLNAILCAEIVEAVSERPLDRFASEHVFGPLGMRDSGFHPDERLRARCVPSTKTDYGRGAGGFLQGQVHDPLAAMQAGVSGNAGLFSTAADLECFAQMMLNGGELDGMRVLKAETIADMTRVQNPGAKNAKGKVDRRGLLWDLYVPDPGDKGVDALFAYGHTGYTGTAIRIYPEQGVYVIALANRVHPDDSGKVGEFRRQVWQMVGEVLMGISPE